ncbi:MAG: hypothetical protein ABIJ39_11200 [Chloroflexota bacterium]
MSNIPNSNDKLSRAANAIKDGRRNHARQLIREVLIEEPKNLSAWELLLEVTETVEEEHFCLKTIIDLSPNHPWARNRLDPNVSDRATSSRLPSGSFSPRRQPPQTGAPLLKQEKNEDRRKRSALPLFLIIFALFGLIAIVYLGIAIYRSGYLSFSSSPYATTVMLIEPTPDCQLIVDRAILLSGDACSRIGTNMACYGNDTVQADLFSGSPQQFDQRGDVIDINLLRRLSASPLNLQNHQWGIAIFRLLANLPGSLPGESVTVVVFGNTQMETDSPGLETFYFSSELGSIVCGEVPFDGLMISMPDGVGISLSINGTDLTLMGDASLKATAGGEMEISMYSGSGRIVSSGQEQFFGAGQSVNVPLGGPDGRSAIGPPSAPVGLSPDELRVACTMTGQFCTQDEILPVDETQARDIIQAAMSATPAIYPTSTSSTPQPTTGSPTATSLTVTRTATPLPSRTPTQTCGSITAGGLGNPSPIQLSLQINNNSGSTITITELLASWIETPASQKLRLVLLNVVTIWSGADPDNPSSIPGELPWTSSSTNRQISSGSSPTLVLEFQDDLQATGYNVNVRFDNGCQVSGSR